MAFLENIFYLVMMYGWLLSFYVLIGNCIPIFGRTIEKPIWVISLGPIIMIGLAVLSILGGAVLALPIILIINQKMMMAFIVYVTFTLVVASNLIKKFEKILPNYFLRVIAIPAVLVVSGIMLMILGALMLLPFIVWAL